MEENKKERQEKKKEEERKKHNKQLKGILIVLGIVAILFIGTVFFIHQIRHFEYKGIDFEVQKFGDLIVYKTTFGIQGALTGKAIANYNVYFRKDPRESQIPFDGKINLLDNLVINSTMKDNCEGYGVVSVANFVKVFDLLGTRVIQDNNATCDEQGRYMFVQLQEGDESKIVQYGPACYTLTVNNCEVLDVTEKFIIEGIIEYNR